MSRYGHLGYILVSTYPYKEVTRIEFKCSSALGIQGQGETLAEYVRRQHYELQRIDAIADQHRRWHTHTDNGSTECFICAYGHLARCYLKTLADYGNIPTESGPTTTDGSMGT